MHLCLDASVLLGSSCCHVAIGYQAPQLNIALGLAGSSKLARMAFPAVVGISRSVHIDAFDDVSSLRVCQ
jgi:hypothetical protein